MLRGVAVVSMPVLCAMVACSTPGTAGGSAGAGDATGEGGGNATGAAGSSATAAGGSAAIVTKPATSYAQNAASNGAFPYPQGHALPHCSFPVYNTDDVETAYMNWKAKFFVNGTIVRPENGNDTVSEGIGYGMLIAVFMDDKDMFDTLWTYGKSHNDGKGLMTWCEPTGMPSSCSGSNSATDGDEDMAYALLMASKQWSGGSYATDAMNIIKALLGHDVSGNILEGGDGFNNTTEIDPSYFAPSYYRAFAAFDTADSATWMALLDKSYSILAAAQGSDGLVPNWVNQQGVGITSVDTMNGPYFGYDACRIPFRIALDYCLNGEPRAQSYAQLITTFYMSKASATSFAGLNDGYTTTGANPPGSLGDYPAGMAFTGPAGVAAMAAGDSADALRNLSYRTMWADTTQGAMKVSGTFTYFNASWGVLSLLAMSGNFWDLQ
jgi:endo-1,4-beta-D-glucanase Y